MKAKLKRYLRAAIPLAFTWALSPLDALAQEACHSVFTATHETKPVPQGPEKLLHDGRDFVRKYNKVIANLKPGDHFTMPSGRKYQVKAILGQGQLTKVVDIGDGWAMRLPLFVDSSNKATDAIKDFYNIQPEIKAAGIRTVEMDVLRSEPPFGVIVKKENFHFLGTQFLEAEQNGWPKKISAEEIQLAKEKFEDFMRSTWRYVSIGDVTPRQIGFNGREWVLFDFYRFGGLPMHAPLRNFSEKDIMMGTLEFEDAEFGNSKTSFLPPQLEKKLYAEINHIRSTAAKKGIWYERSSSRVSNKGEFVEYIMEHPLTPAFVRSFNTKDFLFRRDLQGFCPKGDDLKVEIKKLVGTKNNLANYKATVNNEFNVELVIAIDGKMEVWKQIAELEDKAVQDKRLYFAGTDFILYYNKSDAQKLQQIEDLH